MNIGEKIKKLRIEKGLTQKELANFLKTSDRAVGYYENNNRTPPAAILKEIANYYNVSLDYLMGNTDVRNHESIKDKDIVNIVKARDKMPEEKRDKMMKILRIMFDEYFE